MSEPQEYKINCETVSKELYELFEKFSSHLRDDFAKAALTGLIQAYMCGMIIREERAELPSYDFIAEQSFKLADAALAARARKG